MCGNKPLNDELTIELRKCVDAPDQLALWLRENIRRPNLGVKIAEILADPQFRAHAHTLRSAFLKCLCPKDASQEDWEPEDRQALLVAVGEAFGARKYTPMLAKMEQFWGWQCDWSPALKRPVFDGRKKPASVGIITLGTVGPIVPEGSARGGEE